MPSNLKGSVKPFTYNNIEELEEIFQNNDLAVKMEVQSMPKGWISTQILKMCKNNVILIFDECSSLERHLEAFIKYGVEPDMAMFGKALRMVMP